MNVVGAANRLIRCGNGKHTSGRGRVPATEAHPFPSNAVLAMGSFLQSLDYDRIEHRRTAK